MSKYLDSSGVTYLWNKIKSKFALITDVEQLSEEIANKQPKGDYALKSEIPSIPTSLKNPYALTFKLGSTTYTYDGSKAISITIEDGNEVAY